MIRTQKQIYDDLCEAVLTGTYLPVHFREQITEIRPDSSLDHLLRAISMHLYQEQCQLLGKVTGEVDEKTSKEN